MGILIYLAHLGSWLPCEKAIIGLTDWIFARISTIETVSCPESAFAADLTQVSRMLQSHTSRSLCLIDEFGKGTSPIDGIALLGTTIRHFIENKAKVFCVLHFTEIFHSCILDLDDHDSLASKCITPFCMQMYNPDKERDVNQLTSSNRANRANDNNPFYDENIDEDTVKLPLYSLGLGISKSSEGIACAKSAGLPDRILHRARDVKRAIESRSHIKPLGICNNGSLSNTVNA